MTGPGNLGEKLTGRPSRRDVDKAGLSALHLVQAQLCGDTDRTRQRTVHRAGAVMDPMNLLDGFLQRGRGLESIGNMDMPDDQDLVFGNNISSHFGK